MTHSICILNGWVSVCWWRLNGLCFVSEWGKIIVIRLTIIAGKVRVILRWCDSMVWVVWISIIEICIFRRIGGCNGCCRGKYTETCKTKWIMCCWRDWNAIDWRRRWKMRFIHDLGLIMCNDWHQLPRRLWH